MESIALKVVPNAKVNHVGPFRDEVLSVRVNAAPENGVANKKVCELIAKTFGLSKGKVSLLKGHKNRNKRISIDIEAEELYPILRDLK